MLVVVSPDLAGRDPYPGIVDTVHYRHDDGQGLLSLGEAVVLQHERSELYVHPLGDPLLL